MFSLIRLLLEDYEFRRRSQMNSFNGLIEDSYTNI